MGKRSKNGIEAALRAHYRAERTQVSDERKREVVRAIVAEGRKATSADSARAGLAAFVSAQVRFVSWRIWAVQACLVIMMAALCSSGQAESTLTISSIGLAAASAAVGQPSLLASKTHGVFELEQACRFNAAAVALARLVILGCSSVAVLTGIVAVVPVLAGGNAFAALMHVCVPYFIACAGCLLIARKAPRTQSLMLSLAWTAVVAMMLYFACSLFPEFYSLASMGAWSAAAAMGLVWLARELAMWVRENREPRELRGACRTLQEEWGR